MVDGVAQPIIKASMYLAFSTQGWSVAKKTTGPESVACEYRDEVGGRLPFAYLFVVFPDGTVDMTLTECDWKLIGVDGVGEVVPPLFRRNRSHPGEE